MFTSALINMSWLLDFKLFKELLNKTINQRVKFCQLTTRRVSSNDNKSNDWDADLIG